MRLNLVVEGQTEEAFVNQILKPHLVQCQVWPSARCITTGRKRDVASKGGIGSYARARRDLTTWMKEDRNADIRFSTMFDLYGLPSDFPGYESARDLSDPFERVEQLQDAMRNDLEDGRFIPYLQLHEFEALLLADPQKFRARFSESGAGIQKLVELVSSYECPELIDDGYHTAPSRRIADLIPEYAGAKVSAGPIVAANIGLHVIRSKCRHFGKWLGTLEDLARHGTA